MADIYYEDELSPIPEEKVSERLDELTRRFEGAIPSAGIEKPFLTTEDLEGGPRKEIVILEWMDFLFGKNDFEDIIEVLSYYMDMGWIDGGARSDLLSYTRSLLKSGRPGAFSGVRMGEKDYKISEESTEESGGEGYVGGMTPKDHMHSLLYILEIVKDKVGGEIYRETLRRAGFEEEG